jgi:hypothetical protein
MWKNTLQPDRPQMTIWRMRIVYVGWLICRHTLRMWNTYCFSADKIVTRTHLDVILHLRCLSQNAPIGEEVLSSQGSLSTFWTLVTSLAIIWTRTLQHSQGFRSLPTALHLVQQRYIKFNRKADGISDCFFICILFYILLRLLNTMTVL